MTLFRDDRLRTRRGQLVEDRWLRTGGLGQLVLVDGDDAGGDVLMQEGPWSSDRESADEAHQ